MPNVLVVDDDPLMGDRLETLLAEIDGLSVDVVRNQKAAEELIRKKTYRLALVDIELGPAPTDKYAGLALLQELSHRDCTTLIVSGTAEANLKRISVALKAYDFIAKPIDDLDFPPCQDSCRLDSSVTYGG